MAEELVIISQDVAVPFRITILENQPYLLTHQRFQDFEDSSSRIRKVGEMTKGSRITVKQLFTRYGFSGTVQYSELEVTNIKKNESMIAYANWEDILKALKEIPQNTQ